MARRRSRSRSRSRPKTGGGGRSKLRIAVVLLIAIALVVAAGPVYSFTNLLSPRDTDTDVVSDPEGVIGLNNTAAGGGATLPLANITNKLDQDVTLTIELTGDSTDWATLLVDGVDYGDSATISGVGSGQNKTVEVSVTCDDSIVGKNVTYDVTAEGTGITGQFDRSVPINRYCLTWYTASDWDGSTTEHGVVHEDFGDHNAADVELGYPSSESGLVSYWPLDEDSGNTATDVTGSNDGTRNGATTGQTGILNTTAYGFDGNDDNVTVSTDSSLNITENITASAWIDPDSAPTAQSLTAQGYTGHQFIGMKWQGGDIDCTSDANFDPAMIHPYASAAYGDSNWDAGSSWDVYDTSQASVYGDYSQYQIDFDTVWGSDVDNGEAYVGAYIYSPDSRTVDISLGSDDTRKLWVNGNLEHQECDDQALTVDDSTVTGISLHEGWNTVVMMVNEDSGGWGAQWRISSNNNGSLQYTADPAVLVDKQAYQLSLKGSDVTASFGSDVVDASVPTGSFSQVAMRTDTSQLEVFVNGSSQETTSISTSPTNSSQPLVMGENYDGRLDEVRLYDRTLGNGEVEALAEGSSPDDPNAVWNGTLITGWASTDAALDTSKLELSDVIAGVSGGPATVYVESDTNDDNSPDETSDPVSLDGTTGPYSVTGLSTDSDTFRLRIELNTSSPTTAPCFSGATLSEGSGLSTKTRSGCGQSNVTENQPPTADFTTRSVNWYNESWAHRKPITIDHTKVAANHSNFPVLISLTDSDLADKAQTDGDDILFTKADGTTQLDHEIESFDGSSGALVAWVNVPQVNATTPDTTLYMYYGNSTVANQENVAGVWGADYDMVQHFEESSGTPTDSTSNTNDGTNNGATQGVTGQINGAYGFSGSNDYVDVPDSINDGGFTIEFWFKSPGSTWDGTLFDATSVPSGEERLFVVDGGDTTLDFVFEDSNDANMEIPTSPDLSDGGWHHVVATGTFNGASHELYLDGATQDTDGSSMASKPVVDGPRFGNYTTTATFGSYDKSNFDGDMDEVRILSRRISDAWVTTEYNNMNDPSSFASVGAEEDSTATLLLDASSSSDPDGTISTYKWDFDSDGTYENVTTTATTTHSFDAGDHDVTLQVIDDDSASDTKTKTITVVTQSPIAKFSYTESNTSWYDTSWNNRKKITIDHTKVAADHSDFPVLINITDSDLANKAQADGDDIVFTAGNGTTQLDHEIESFDSTTGDLVAWVKVPQVNATSPDTAIYLYYNNSGAANQENATGVWTNGYAMIHHLEESSGSAMDSTSNDNDGTVNGATQGSSGQVDGGYDFDGSSDEVDVPHDSSIDIEGNMTVSAWVRHDSNDYMGAVGKLVFDSPDYYGYSLVHYSDDTFAFFVADSGATEITNSDSTYTDTGTWHHLVGVRRDGTNYLYVDGVEQTETGTQSLGDSGNPLKIGRQYADFDGRWWNGAIDEVRVSNTSRSADWISTKYNNTNDPGSFHSVGTEEVQGKPTVDFDASNSSDPDGSISTYKWDFDGDGGFEASQSSATITHQFDSSGTYNVTLEVVDNQNAKNSTTKTITIGNQDPTADFTSSSWNGRKAITIDHRKVDSDLTDFPMLVSLTDSDLTTAQSDGDDILFTESDGETKLDHEIESFDGGTGDLVAWVKVPQVNSTAPNTTIYLYYNNSAAANQENVSGVWDSNYKMVQHLEESSGDATDSTSYGNDGTTVDVAARGQAGIAGDAYDFEASNGHGIEVPDDASLDITSEVTLSAWIDPETVDNWNRIVAKSHTANEDPWTMYGLLFDDADHLRMEISDCNSAGCQNGVNGATTVPTTSWTHATAVYNGTHMVVYYNGSQDGVASLSTTIATNDVNLTIGKSGFDADYYDGLVDEVRVSDTARSPAWISASFENQRDPSGFYTVGSEENGALARFDASNSSDPDGPISTYEWDFTDDGTYEESSSSATTLHRYSSTGTYNVTLRVTDDGGATDTTTKSITLGGEGSNAAPTADFTSSSWNGRKAITIDHRKVATDLTDYPVLIDVSDSDLAADAQADGDDILFTESDGETKLAHEIETFNGSNGHLVAWVKVPNVSSTSDTTIYMYFNNTGAANQENVSEVWSNGYEGVWHLNESGDGTAGEYDDSTANDNDGQGGAGTSSAVPTRVDGKITGGQQFDGDDDYINSGSDASLNIRNQVTIEAWVNLDQRPATDDWYNVQSKETYSMYLYGQSGSKTTLNAWFEIDGQDHDLWDVGVADLTPGTWHHVVLTFDGTDIKGYVNGSHDWTQNEPGTIDDSSSYDFLIANYSTEDMEFDGPIDEVQVSSVARSDAWISTEYNNTNDPSSFYTVGSEENGALARFDASNSSDPDGSISTYEWDFTDDGTYEESSSSATTLHRYSSTGTYNVTLRVTDDGGATDTTTKSITLGGEGSNAAPTADFTYSPSTPTTEDTVTFDASSSSDSDGTVDTYKWDWDDDGTFEDTTSSATIDHTFSTAGDHDVTLQAVDNEGAIDNVTKTVSVSSASFTNETSTANLGTTPGGGVILFPDIDEDGYLDVFMNDNTSGSDTVRLRENDGDNTFTDRDARIDPNTGGRGAGVGDANNDTDDDLIIGRAQALHTNDGDGTFTVTTAGSSNNDEAFMFADIDGDGDLDIWSPGESYLWHENTASGWTSQSTMPGGVGATHNGEGATAADINDDGYIDFMWSCGGDCASRHVMVFTNDGDYTYTYHDNTTANFGDLPNDVAVHENMEWAWGDYDDDGDLDVFVSGATNEGLYRNDGTGSFTDVTSSAGISVTDPDGAAWGDYDNDGDLDLVVVQQGGVSALYSNDGDGTFTDVASDVGLGSSGDLGKTVGFFDSDNDGDLDLITNDPARFHTNDLDDGQYLRVIVRGNSSSGGSPETPIGAQITVYDNSTGSIVGHREVFASYNQLQPPLRQHFGLDPTGRYDIEVRFPSGKVVWRNDTRPDQHSVTIGGNTLNNTLEITEDPIFADDFDRADSTTVGNGWTETEPNADDAQILSNRLDFNPDDTAERPVVEHTFAKQATGKVKLEFTYNFERNGSENTYGVSIQLGDSGSMVDPGTDHDQGVGVNLKWGGNDGTVSDMTDDEGFGYTLNGADTQIGVVSGKDGSNAGGNATITVVADLDANTYNITVTGPGLVSGSGTATDVAFDNDVDVDTIRIFLDEVNEVNFDDLEIDDVRITDEE